MQWLLVNVNWLCLKNPTEEYFNSIIKWHETRNGVTGLTEEHIGYKSAFYLGHEVARDNIRAAFNGGILKIMIPKDAEHTASEPIEIEIM